MNTYRRILRAADKSHPYWVAVLEDKCIGQNYDVIRDFCEQRGLSLSRHGHSVTHQSEYYQVFMFADDEHADIFCTQFGGERMEPSEKGKGRHWSSWRKGTAQPSKR
jgi:hypothetical protein